MIDLTFPVNLKNMKNHQQYNIASVIFLVTAGFVFSYSGYALLGITTVNLFLALIAMAYICAFIALMKNRKSVVSWLLIILNSIFAICIIYFLTHFKMKL